MPRIRLYDCRISDLPELIGRCQADVPSIANAVNRAQRRLLTCREVGDEGWNGTFSEVAFTTVSRNQPYITTPREIARIEVIDICNRPVPINNQFVEYLQFGNGRMPKLCPRDCLGITNVYQRNNVITFTDIPSPPMFLRVYTTDIADVGNGKRVLLQGTDQNDSVIWTQDNLNQVMGEFVTIATPFANSTFTFNSITGIQKDITAGQIQIFAVDATTGQQTLIHTMEPSETVAGYRRYFLDNLPPSCCATTATPIQNLRVTAIAKMEMIPVMVDTDYLLITSLEAIIEECQAIRFESMDNANAKAQAAYHHKNAINYLNGELCHLYGKDNPAVSFAPFGSARLEHQRIGVMI